MAARRYLRSVDFYDEMEDIGLQCDEKYLYAYLSLNRHMSVSGIYEIQRRVIMVDTGISRDRIDACLQRLVGLDLIRYDAGLMFVPRIHVEQSLQTRKGWQSMLRRLRRIHKDHRSDLPGAENQAYTAFIATLAEFYYEIDSADLQDAEEAQNEDALTGESATELNESMTPEEAFEHAVEQAKSSRNGAERGTSYPTVLDDSGRNPTQGRPPDDSERPPPEPDHPTPQRFRSPDVTDSGQEIPRDSREILEKSWEI